MRGDTDQIASTLFQTGLRANGVECLPSSLALRPPKRATPCNILARVGSAVDQAAVDKLSVSLPDHLDQTGADRPGHRLMNCGGLQPPPFIERLSRHRVIAERASSVSASAATPQSCCSSPNTLFRSDRFSLARL